VKAERLNTISGLQEKVLHDPKCMKKLIADFTIQVTEMFRDPNFFKAFREKVIPVIRGYPFIRLWHAGCSSGEEIYSMAILLYEQGLYDKSIIYATDINEEALEKASAGVFPLEKMKIYTNNYLKSGGEQAFSEYYTATDKEATFHSFLRKNIVFAQHNLVTDGSFNEFNVIICRNVMIYFNKDLQNRVHQLFYESLSPYGFLGLGKREAIKFSIHEDCYQVVDGEEKIYHKTAKL
jgi:chemotaxis protein methyltransferase CheR